MNKLIIIVLVLSNFLTLNAENKISELKTKYPNADAVYLKLNKSYTLNKDGSIVFKYHHKLALLTPYAFFNLCGETFISYNPLYQKLKINLASTETPDGKQVIAPQNAFNEVLPSNAANAPFYTNLKEMVVSHTGLITGAIVTLDYELTSNAQYSNALMANELLVLPSPIEQYELQVTYPKDVVLNVATFNINKSAEKTSSAKTRTYKWKLENLGADTFESFNPQTEKPRIIFTTETLETQMRKINQSVNGEIPSAIFEWAKVKMADKKNMIEKVFALQKAVVEEINSYGVSFEQAAFRYRTCEEVFNANGGTEIEKTILLANILKKMALDVDVESSLSSYLMKNKAENCLLVNHLYVRTIVNGEKLRLSAVENNANPTNVSDALTFIGKDIENSLPSIANVEVMSVFKTTKENKLEGKLMAKMSGGVADNYSLFRTPKYVNSLFNMTMNSVASSFKNDTLSVNYDFSQTLPAAINGGYHAIQLPEANGWLSTYKTAFLISDRKSNFHFPVLMKEKQSYIISLAEKWILLDPNVNIVRKTPFAELIISIKQFPDRDKVTITRSFKLLKQQLHPGEYKQLTNLLSIWYDKKYTTLIFK